VGRVTVGIAVYNGAETIGRAIESVLSQTYRDFDVLVIDDGSQDDSADIAKGYGVPTFSQPNAGLGATRARLVSESPGEWVAFLDHDDTWHPDKLARQMGAIQHGDVLCHTEATFAYSDHDEVRRQRFTGDGFQTLLPNNRVIASSAVFNREAMVKAGNFVADTIRCSDWYGWMLLASVGTFQHVPESLVRYHVLESSLANAGFRFYDARRHLIENHFLLQFERFFCTLPPKRQIAIRRQLRRELALSLSGMARSQQSSGNRSEAVQLAKRALSMGADVAKVVSRASGILLGR